jgi:hypothetical protein
MNMNCNEAKRIDIISFLARNGINPYYTQGVNHWYKSPLRNEKNPFFKVNSFKNLWFDFGIGEGGDIIKLTSMLFKVDSSNALKILSNNHYSSHQKVLNSEDSKVLITNVKEISNIQLINYLESRKLKLQLAKEYCKEVSFKLNDKNFYAIGIPAMFSIKMFVEEVLVNRFFVPNQNSIECHPGNLFKSDCIVNCLICIFAPSKRAMTIQQLRRHGQRAGILKRFNYYLTCIGFIVIVYFLPC